MDLISSLFVIHLIILRSMENESNRVILIDYSSRWLTNKICWAMEKSGMAPPG